MRALFLLMAFGGCLPSFPMQGAPRPRLKRAVLIDKVGSSGCYEVCKGPNYAYCTVATISSRALGGGQPRSGSVCFYDR